jgi:type 1 glutamine amidotransferase
MKRRILSVLALLLAVCFPGRETTRADEAKPAARSPKVYGEWLIRPKPDQGAAYKQLIEEKGLPLFREGGGRMVGWWNTLVGNLYEQVTIWEYDDMAAYQKAAEYLGKNDRFAQFVRLRDPLLAGEESRFLILASFAEPPKLAESAPFVIHEIHRVPLYRQTAYLKFMKEEGLPLLKKHGFRPVGPWHVAIGKWSEVTYLFRFDSLAERDRLITALHAHADGQTYGKVLELVDEISTRLLIPTPFAAPRGTDRQRGSSSLLPHQEQLAPGVFATGFAARYQSANCGWVAHQDETLLIDLPHGVPIPNFVSEIVRTTGHAPRKLILTHFEAEDVPLVEAFLEQGVTKVVTSTEIGNRLLGVSKKIAPARIQVLSARTSIVAGAVDFLPLDGIAAKGGAAVYLPSQQVLFAGPCVVHGQRAKLTGTNTACWITALRQLEDLGARQVVPGFGAWVGSELLSRQRRFLMEMRRQVGHLVAQGRPLTAIQNEVRLSAAFLTCTPYGNPVAEDIAHVYQELTVPAAPFNGQVPRKTDSLPHALVLIGDGPHEPGHIEEGLEPVFSATGAVPHFTVDVRALSAENLARVQLLVILRDGLQRPSAEPKSHYIWMTHEQERAVVQFVAGGGAVLNLHNALGLYPAEGPYLRLMGGKYTGHGPLERFRVEVVDSQHPITGGIQAFSVIDEQHTPVYDAGKVHLLLRSRSDEGKEAAAGWAYEPGPGRVCHLAPGHTREALLHPMYQLLLRNAVNWCLRRAETKATPRMSSR